MMQAYRISKLRQMWEWEWCIIILWAAWWQSCIVGRYYYFCSWWPPHLLLAVLLPGCSGARDKSINFEYCCYCIYGMLCWTWAMREPFFINEDDTMPYLRWFFRFSPSKRELLRSAVTKVGDHLQLAPAPARSSKARGSQRHHRPHRIKIYLCLFVYPLYLNSGDL